MAEIIQLSFRLGSKFGDGWYRLFLKFMDLKVVVCGLCSCYKERLCVG